MSKLYIEVLHENGKTTVLREATLQDIERSAQLFDAELVLVTRELVMMMGNAADRLKQAINDRGLSIK